MFVPPEVWSYILSFVDEFSQVRLVSHEFYQTSNQLCRCLTLKTKAWQDFPKFFRRFYMIVSMTIHNAKIDTRQIQHLSHLENITAYDSRISFSDVQIPVKRLVLFKCSLLCIQNVIFDQTPMLTTFHYVNDLRVSMNVLMSDKQYPNLVDFQICVSDMILSHLDRIPNVEKLGLNHTGWTYDHDFLQILTRVNLKELIFIRTAHSCLCINMDHLQATNFGDNVDIIRFRLFGPYAEKIGEHDIAYSDAAHVYNCLQKINALNYDTKILVDWYDRDYNYETMIPPIRHVKMDCDIL